MKYNKDDDKNYQNYQNDDNYQEDYNYQEIDNHDTYNDYSKNKNNKKENKDNLNHIYKLNKPNFSHEEKELLNDLRKNLVDLAISSGDDFHLDEKSFITDIKSFLKLKLFSNQEINNHDLKNMPNDMIHNDFNENNDFEHFSEYNLEDEFEYNSDYIEKLSNSDYIDNLSYQFFQYIVGYGEIDSLIKDDSLEEIMILGVNKPVFVYHREYGMMESNLVFSKEEEIISIIDTVARQINRRIDQESPILDGRLTDGSRVNATISPISADGPSITIRKFKKDPLTIIDLIKSNTINCDLAAFFWLCFDGLGVKPANAIISGGTSSGKTTMLNALSSFINPKERIITIEDTLELQINHKHLLRMETRMGNIENKGEINMDDLVKNSLRQRPDRVIVGEVRGKEAITLFTALNTGHSGFGTLHSNNSRETITRLTNQPMNVPKIMISAIDFIIMLKRIYRSDGVSIRRISEVDEVVGIEEGTIQLNKLYKWDGKTDTIENVAISSNTLREIAIIKGVPIKDLENEITKRKKLLKFLVDNDIRSIKNLSTIIENYYIDSKRVLDSMNLHN